MLDQVVHNLTHRRFKNTPRESVYELGSAVTNSFFDPRNVGNYEAGEIAPSGNYLTHYPVNSASNTAGFSIMDDEGNDKKLYYASQVYNTGNSNVLEQKISGSGSGPSNGSSSDYLYFNPWYEALLNPKSKQEMNDIAQPHFLPVNKLNQEAIAGRGTNAPSSASSVDYAMNNPYSFPSNFNKGGTLGGSLGASSSGSSSDYYDSNPNRVPEMQSETRHYTDFMEGGAIDWGKYLGHIRKGVDVGLKVAPHVPDIIEGVKNAKIAYKEPNIKNVANLKKGAKASINTIKELRKAMKGKGTKKAHKFIY